jgi:hypothetical protein
MLAICSGSRLAGAEIWRSLLSLILLFFHSRMVAIIVVIQWPNSSCRVSILLLVFGPNCLSDCFLVNCNEDAWPPEVQGLLKDANMCVANRSHTKTHSPLFLLCHTFHTGEDAAQSHSYQGDKQPFPRVISYHFALNSITSPLWWCDCKI